MRIFKHQNQNFTNTMLAIAGIVVVVGINPLKVYADERRMTGYAGAQEEYQMWKEGGALDYAEELSTVKRTSAAPAAFPAGVDTNGLDELKNVSYLPAVKDQGMYGTCWAFSGNSLVEIYLAKHGYISADSIDLAESQTTYYSGHYSVDANNQFDGDDFAAKNMADVFRNGSNYSKYVDIVGDWKGLAPESINGGNVINYNDASIKNIYKNGLPSQYGYAYEQAHITGYQILKMPTIGDSNYRAEAEEIKQAVMENGAIGISYYADGMTTSNEYYVEENAAYYSYGNNFSNHAVALVGWDDNYPAENFECTDGVNTYGKKPAGDGAWIVRNSWDDTYGNGGYFYLSYYDTTASDDIAIALSAKLASDDYDNIYQFDGGASSANKVIDPGVKCANVFKVFSDNETIEAVAVEVASSNSVVAIDVYSHLTDLTNPASGNLVEHRDLTAPKAGMYRVPLSNKVLINEGEYFSVVVYSKNSKAITIKYDRAAAPFFSYTGDVTAKANESYELFDDGWKDISKNNWWNRYNFGIKAFTSNYDGPEVLPTAIVFDVDSATIYENKTGANTLDIGATVYPSNCTAKRLNWTSSNERVAVVDNFGHVTAVGRGSCTITATDKKGQGLSASCAITVKRAVTQYTITCDRTTVVKGDKIQLYTYMNPSDADIEYRETWSSSNEAVATVDKGVVKTYQAGVVRISAKYGDLIASVLIEVVDEWREGLYQARNGNYYLYENNEIVTDYNGIYYDQRLGWWYLKDGMIDFTFNDLYGDANYGWWKINGGTIDFAYSGAYCSPTYGWWIINGGCVEFNYSDFYYDNTYGWIKVLGGCVDWGYNGLYCSPQLGWWKVVNGTIDFGYSDIYGDLTYGWWKIFGGAVDFSSNCMYYSETYGLWKITNGVVDFNYNDLFMDPNLGWIKVTGGLYDYYYEGLFGSPTVGWWKVHNGTIDFGFTGIYDDPLMGGWYIRDGAIDFTRVNPLVYNYRMYVIHYGCVVDSWDLSDEEIKIFYPNGTVASEE